MDVSAQIDVLAALFQGEKNPLVSTEQDVGLAAPESVWEEGAVERCFGAIGSSTPDPPLAQWCTVLSAFFIIFACGPPLSLIYLCAAPHPL